MVTKKPSIIVPSMPATFIPSIIIDITTLVTANCIWIASEY